MGHGNNHTSVGKKRDMNFKRRSSAASRSADHAATTSTESMASGAKRVVAALRRSTLVADDDSLLPGRGGGGPLNVDHFTRSSDRRITSPRLVDHTQNIPLSFDEDDSLIVANGSDRHRLVPPHNAHVMSTSTTSSSSSRSKRNLLLNDRHRAEIRHLERAYDVNEQRIRHLERMVDQLTSELHQPSPSNPSHSSSVTQHHNHHHSYSTTPHRPSRSPVPATVYRKKSEK